MRILYDSKSQEHKVPFGCLRQEQLCRIMVKVPVTCRAREIFVMIEDDEANLLYEYPLDITIDNGDYVEISGEISLNKCGLYYYYFKIVTEDSWFFLFKEGRHDTSMNTGGKWQLTCFKKGYDTPGCFKGKVMYQIFPDRFHHQKLSDATGKLEPFIIYEDSNETPRYYPDTDGVTWNNDFYGGNLKGITDKLPYLAELNVEAIYLNPIFMAYSNHRYDTCDYKRIDPLLGTEEDFIELCEKAHDSGIKIILDAVFSHTGDRSVYFDKRNEFGGGAYHNPDSPYRAWYQFAGEEPDGYRSWWGINTLPCTEELSDGFLDFIIRDEDSVVAYWLKRGADGFRLDVADELPDEFIEALHKKVREVKPEAIVYGEVWEDASNKISYGVRRKYFVSEELDATMNYPYKDAIIGFVQNHTTSEQLAETVMTIAENYPKPVLDCVMNSLSTHDIMRILTVLGVEQYPQDRNARAVHRLNEHELRQAVTKLKLAAFLQFTLPGNPCIYYGDEAGLEGFEDPFNRRCFPWDTVNEELLGFHKELGRIKKQYQALQTGDISVTADYDGVFVFRRRHENSTLAVITCMRDYYDCFVSGRNLVYHNGTMRDGHLILNRYGFALLEIISD